MPVENTEAIPLSIANNLPISYPDLQSPNTTDASPETPPIPALTWMETSPSPLSSELTDTDTSEETDYIHSHDTYRSSENNTPSNDSTSQQSLTSPTSNELTLASEPDNQYDNIMTGWDPIPPIVGHKRPRSPEADAANRKRGKENISSSEKTTDTSANKKQSLTMPQISGQSERPPTFNSDDYTDERIMTGWDPVKPLAGQKRDHSPEGETMITKRGRKVKRVDYNRLHHGLSANESSDPKTWEEAMTSPESRQWKIAALEEFRSLLKTGTFKIINKDNLLKGRKPMRCKWVFKKKFLADGSVDKWKARCTAKGFTQRPGIDYQETFAPTPRPETGRIMLVLAHYLGWHRFQGDVPTAFLNPDLNIDLYMEMPKGFEKPDRVILLKKGLYGLKQAAALWYDDARATLSSLGLHPTMSDVCLYTNKETDLFVLLHVDDFQVMGPNLKKIGAL
ncbi:hypothetical protein K3495_g15405, partial [Podosphaera aphanis]